RNWGESSLSCRPHLGAPTEEPRGVSQPEFYGLSACVPNHRRPNERHLSSSELIPRPPRHCLPDRVERINSSKTAPSSTGLGRLVLSQKIMGSNPIGVT